MATDRPRRDPCELGLFTQLEETDEKHLANRFQQVLEKPELLRQGRRARSRRSLSPDVALVADFRPCAAIGSARAVRSVSPKG